MEANLQGRAIGTRADFDEDLVVLTGSRGRWFAHKCDTYVPGEIERTGIWAADDVEVFERFVKPGDHVLELGGHIGHHSVVLAKLVGVNGHVTTVEAQREMARLIRMNAALNRCENVTVYHRAIGDMGGEISMYWSDYKTPANLGAITMLPDLPEAMDRVSVVAIDELPLERLDFIKCDVQGAEVGAIMSGQHTIARLKPIIYVEIGAQSAARLGREYRDIYSFLFGLGYRAEHSSWVTTESDGVPSIASSDPTEWMVSFIPPER